MSKLDELKTKLNFTVFKIYAQATKQYFENLFSSHTTRVDIHITDVERTKWNKNTTDIATLNGSGDGSVRKTVSDAIAEVIADAPESLDTLKEVSDWINTHGESASAMNTQIQENKRNIESNANRLTTSEENIESNRRNIESNSTKIQANADKIAESNALIADNTSKIANQSTKYDSLNRKLGNTDLTGLGDGTLTGAIRQISTNTQIGNYIAVSGTKLVIINNETT